jgi:hypothetical protein
MQHAYSSNMERVSKLRIIIHRPDKPTSNFERNSILF